MRLLRRDRIAIRTGPSASVYLAATLDYIAAEIFELAIEQMKLAKKKRIVTRHLMLSIEADGELSKLLHGAIFAQAGKPLFVHPELDKKRKAKKEGSDNIDPSQEV